MNTYQTDTSNTQYAPDDISQPEKQLTPDMSTLKN